METKGQAFDQYQEERLLSHEHASEMIRLQS